MAGVPGLSLEQKKAALRADMKPGDSLIEVSPGEWQILRSAKRDVDQSILNTVGQLADKYLGFGDDRRRARILSGVASQWYGLDDAGNPTFGKTPGIVHETKALGAVPTMILRAVMDKTVSTLGPMYGLSKNAPADPTYQMVQQALIGDPEWATEAMEKSDQIHKAVREDMRLKAPQSFAENAQESLGVMLGQLPVPGKAVAKGAEEMTRAQRLGDIAEWFTPTVRPSVGNYAIGTGTGAVLGTLAGNEDEELPTILPDPEQEGLYHVRPMYSDGSVGYSGHPDDVEAEQGLARGGKVRALTDWLESFKGTKRDVIDPEGDIGGLIRRTRFNPRLSLKEIELLDAQSAKGMSFPESDYQEFLELVDKHAIPIEGEQLFRGVRLLPKTPLRAVAERGDAPMFATTDPDHAKIYASLPVPRDSSPFDLNYEMIMNEGVPALMDLRLKGARAFPHPMSVEDEVVFPPGYKLKPKGRPWTEAFDEDDELGPGQLFEVFKKDGGQVKDYCSGGVAAVRSMRAKYAEGGKVSSLRAIKEAIAHLDNGDTGAALRTLNASPEALRDPGIAAAMKKLRHPTTAKGGRKVLDEAVTADTNAVKVATFAEGGKVSAASAVVKKARLTLAEAKKVVQGHGHTLVKSDGEYIVKKKGERTRIEGDDSHYYTDDIEDAVSTSAAMVGKKPK